MISHVITPWSPESIGVGIAAQASSAPASAAWPTAAKAYYIPFTVDEDIDVVAFFVYNGAAVSGNVEMAIYDENFNKVGGIAATALSGTNAIQSVTCNNISLSASDAHYYMAIMFTATDGCFSIAPSQYLCRALGVLMQTSGASPLPAAATPITTTSAFIPFFGFSTRTTY